MMYAKPPFHAIFQRCISFEPLIAQFGTVMSDSAFFFFGGSNPTGSVSPPGSVSAPASQGRPLDDRTPDRAVKALSFWIVPFFRETEDRPLSLLSPIQNNKKMLPGLPHETESVPVTSLVFQAVQPPYGRYRF